MYSSENGHGREVKTVPTKAQTKNARSSMPTLMPDPPIKYEANQTLPSPPSTSVPHFNHMVMPPPPVQNFGVQTPDPGMVSDADLLLNLHSPFPGASPPGARSSLQNMISFPQNASIASTLQQAQQNDFSPTFASYGTPSDNSFGDMVIDAQDIDMSLLGVDMMPWDIEYLPHDLLYMGDGNFGMGHAGGGNSGVPDG